MTQTISEPMHLGPVDIRLPPDPQLSRVLRLAASGIASLAEYTVDEIEDIKIIVSEVLIALIEHGAGEPIHVNFGVGASSFTVRGQTAAETFDYTDPDLELSRRVLEGVGAIYGIDARDGTVAIWAVIHRATESD